VKPFVNPTICLVTNRRAVVPDARTLAEELAGLDAQLDDAFDAGVDLVQVRERDVGAAVLRAFVADIVRRAPAGTRIVVNDRADVALAAGTSGLHLRGDGPPEALVRSIGPADWLVGRSVHSAEDARRAGDADYLLFGTVFPSRSKGPEAPVVGVSALEAAARATAVPVLAIGGVTPARVAACRAVGAAGVAAIGVFLPLERAPEALGAAAAVRALRRAWYDAERP
jgi:thiamine-phosphate pyrophosphorylase